MMECCYIKEVVKGFFSLFTGMRVTMGNVFTRPTTVQWPRESAPLPDRFRGHIMMTGSFSLRDIAIAQKDTWNVLYQPILFIVYIITVTLETNRSPFDFSEAESELVAGFHTEYSGMGFSLFFLAEYSYMFIAAGLATVLFLGGWHGPWLPGVAWTLIKIYSIIFLMMWFRWTFPRVRIDQMLSFGWKILLPLSLINFIITAGVLAL